LKLFSFSFSSLLVLFLDKEVNLEKVLIVLDRASQFQMTCLPLECLKEKILQYIKVSVLFFLGYKSNNSPVNRTMIVNMDGILNLLPFYLDEYIISIFDILRWSCSNKEAYYNMIIAISSGFSEGEN
jgi:hypothetical protein